MFAFRFFHRYETPKDTAPGSIRLINNNTIQGN